jgi:uncharacterized protein
MDNLSGLRRASKKYFRTDNEQWPFMMDNKKPNEEILIKLANYRMPYGRFADRLLLEIPEEYYIWFRNKGFPEGELGDFMSMMLELKTNGIEHVLVPLKKPDNS